MLFFHFFVIFSSENEKKTIALDCLLWGFKVAVLIPLQHSVHIDGWALDFLAVFAGLTEVSPP